MASRAHSSHRHDIVDRNSSEDEHADFSNGSSDDYHPSSDSDITESGKIIIFIAIKLHYQSLVMFWNVSFAKVNHVQIYFLQCPLGVLVKYEQLYQPKNIVFTYLYKNEAIYSINLYWNCKKKLKSHSSLWQKRT